MSGPFTHRSWLFEVVTIVISLLARRHLSPFTAPVSGSTVYVDALNRRAGPSPPDGDTCNFDVSFRSGIAP